MSAGPARNPAARPRGFRAGKSPHINTKTKATDFRCDPDPWEWHRKIGRSEDLGMERTRCGALIEVHRQLGPGLMESAYEACLCAELWERGLDFERQRSLPINYKGVRVESAYRLDVVVGGCVLLELESVERLLPIHEAQVITYLRLSRLPVGLLVAQESNHTLNFNVTALRNGLRRLTPEHPESLKTFRSSDLPVKMQMRGFLRIPRRTGIHSPSSSCSEGLPPKRT